jgi:hypothetical protein
MKPKKNRKYTLPSTKMFTPKYDLGGETNNPIVDPYQDPNKNQYTKSNLSVTNAGAFAAHQQAIPAAQANTSRLITDPSGNRIRVFADGTQQVFDSTGTKLLSSNTPNQFANGGINNFLKNVGDFGVNMLKSDANTIGGAVGYKPFADNDFKGYGKGFADNMGNIGSDLTKTGAQFGANALLPGSGAALGVIQNQVGQATQSQQNPTQTNKTNNHLNTGMQIANIAGSFRKGGQLDINNTKGLYHNPNTPYQNADNNAREDMDYKFQQPNAEVEKQENAISPDGTFKQFDGNSHENGGIKTNLPQGAIIFSDKLKPTGSKETFAKLNKVNDTKNEDKIISDKFATKESKATAQLMDSVKNKNSQALFEKQEDLKKSKLQASIERAYMKYGGKTPSYENGGMNYYPNGGVQPSQVVYNPNGHNRRVAFEDGGIQDANYNYPRVYGNVYKGTHQEQNGGIGIWADGGKLEGEDDPGYGLNFTADDVANAGKTNTQNTNQPFNWKSAAYQGLGTLAQSAGQLAYLGEQGKRYDKQNMYTYKPTLLDPSAALRDADIQSNAGAYSLKEGSGGNAGNYLSNRIALAGNNTVNKASIRNQYDNENAQIQNRGQEFNIGNQYRTDDINAQRKGQMLSNYYQTLGSVGTNVASGMRDYKADQIDQQKMNMLPMMYSNPEFQKYWNSYNK